MRLVGILVLVVVGLALPCLAPHPADATDLRSLNSPNHWAPPPARTPSVLQGGDPKIDRFDRRWHGGHDHGRWHRQGVVLVAPFRCWQSGYWTHQWIPRAHTYNTWVGGHWSPDGRWVEGHYVPYTHHTGYYQPYWVEGYWTAC